MPDDYYGTRRAADIGKKAEKTVMLSLRLPEDLVRKLKLFAVTKRQSIQHVAHVAFDSHLAKYKGWDA